MGKVESGALTAEISDEDRDGCCSALRWIWLHTMSNPGRRGVEGAVVQFVGSSSPSWGSDVDRSELLSPFGADSTNIHGVLRPSLFATSVASTS